MMKRNMMAKIIVMIFMINLMLSVNLLQTHAYTDSAYIGEVHLMAVNSAPSGWALCRGQTMNINESQASQVLYSLIGAKFGGNGSTTFALPDLQAAEPKPGQPGYGMHYYIALWGIYPDRP